MNGSKGSSPRCEAVGVAFPVIAAFFGTMASVNGHYLTAGPSGEHMTGDAQDALADVFPGVRVGGPLEAAPIFAIAAGSADPEELVIRDLVVGTGAEAVPGGTVTAHYVGVSLNSGEVFDASWGRGRALQFPLGRVIEGWQDGIPGMRVGGRRVLVIPGDLAYGPFPPPGAGIGPNETLVFIVDLVSVP